MVIKAVIPGEDISDTRQVRTTVFCDEQGYSLEQEYDEIDHMCVHLIGYIDTKPVATARIIDCGEGVYKIGRVAVYKNLRGSNLGSEIMLACIDFIRSKNGRAIKLSSQISASGFYDKLGFIRKGATYMDGHVEHIDMYLNLDK